MDTTTTVTVSRRGDHWLRCLCGGAAHSGDPHGLCGRCRADQDVRDARDSGSVWAWLRACARHPQTRRDAVLWAVGAAVAAAAGWVTSQRWPGLLDSPAGMALVVAAALVAAAVLTGVQHLLERLERRER